MNIIFVAGIVLAAAALLSSPTQAQVGAPAGATLGVPNVTAPTDSVRQGKAGINAAQAEATRTTGNAELDARATAENVEAGVGDPTLGANANNSANANTTNQSAAVSGNATIRGNNTARTEREITRQLNREQLANASAAASGSTR
jgi:hypothetical protein